MTNKNILLSKANAIIRSGRPLLGTQWKYTIREELVKSLEKPFHPLKLSLIFFRSSGCRFSRQGECTMCDYQIAERVNAGKTLQFVQEAMGKRQEYQVLFIAPLGSMFDPHEVPVYTREEVFKLVAKTNCIAFGTETRPEFLTREAIEEFALILKDKDKQINIGLEAADPWILRNCIGKSFSSNDFRDSASLLKKYQVNPVANILLGAPFLTEYEALASTIWSVNWALNNGAKFCILFPSNVKRWTLQHWLWERGLYHSPSLWAYVEVIYALGSETSNRIALSYYNKKNSPNVEEIPYICDYCYDNVINKLREFQAQGDFSIIEMLREYPCSCRDKWRADALIPPTRPLFDRVAELYIKIASELVGSDWYEIWKDEFLEQLAVDYDSKRLEWKRITRSFN